MSINHLDVEEVNFYVCIHDFFRFLRFLRFSYFLVTQCESTFIMNNTAVHLLYSGVGGYYFAQTCVLP